jgi:uncharacterized membrane protein YeaQ/YmgE (transglycosylase-associated protein family)
MSWLVTGALAGLVLHWLLGGFPGRRRGAIVTGMLGTLLGGSLVTLATGRTMVSVEALDLFVAFAGATLMLVLLRWASTPRTTQPDPGAAQSSSLLAATPRAGRNGQRSNT